MPRSSSRFLEPLKPHMAQNPHSPSKPCILAYRFPLLPLIYLLHIPSSLRKCPTGRQNRCDRQFHKGHIQIFITYIIKWSSEKFLRKLFPPMYLQLREIQFTTISFLVIHSFMHLTQSQTTELAAAAARLEGQSWGNLREQDIYTRYNSC